MNHEEIASLLGPEGPIALNNDSYEFREGQVEMAKMVSEAFSSDQICVVEAGTGIGKSFAYLIPAIMWCAAQQDDRLVIATSTIHLQHQLLEKDIPYLRDRLDVPITAVILKGRNNYLCKRRMMNLITQRELTDDNESEMLTKILTWSTQTHSGDKADLRFSYTQNVWNRVCSDADSCLGFRCPNKDTCFVNKARKEAASSQIIIINHHLLFADMIMKQEDEAADHSVILPAFNRLIIDEAHNIEKNATSYFTQIYDARTLLNYLHMLSHTKMGRTGGLLEDVRAFSDDPMAFNAIYQSMMDLRLYIDQSETELEAFIGDRRNSFFIHKEHYQSHHSMTNKLITLMDQLHVVIRLLKECIDSCSEEAEIVSQIYELQSVRHRMEGMLSLLDHYRSFDLEESHVYWMERWVSRSGIPHNMMKTTPVIFTDLLQEGLFSQYETIVCTSATLTVRDNFSFWEQRVGLDDDLKRPYVKRSIESPFDYRNRVLLCLPTDAPEPTNYREYLAYSCSAIKELIEISEGGALVLFTSYAMLNDVYGEIAQALEVGGLTVLKQGDENRYMLMKRFVEDEKSVLLATQSFWEGVDAPGDTLKLLIVCKLPFNVPTEPIFYAKKLLTESTGGNSFFELALPEAIIKLKQGFGRLMRTSRDRGVVVILDSRLVTKRYGAQVTASLPKTQIYRGTQQRMVERVEDFLYSSQ